MFLGFFCFVFALIAKKIPVLESLSSILTTSSKWWNISPNSQDQGENHLGKGAGLSKLRRWLDKPCSCHICSWSLGFLLPLSNGSRLSVGSRGAKQTCHSHLPRGNAPQCWPNAYRSQPEVKRKHAVHREQPALPFSVCLLLWKCAAPIHRYLCGSNHARSHFLYFWFSFCMLQPSLPCRIKRSLFGNGAA